MRARTWVGAIVLAAVAALLFFLLWPSAPEDSSPAAPGSEAASAAAPAVPRNALLTAELPAAKGSLAIRGRVLGPDGPVAGAIVVASSDGGEEVLSDLLCHCDNRCGQRLLQCGCPEAAAQLVELVLQRRGEAPPIARATSGEDGTFALEGLEEGSFALWAEKPGTLIGLRRAVKAGAEGADVEIGPGMTIRGKAVTDDDQPVPGASITAIYAEHSRFFDGASGPDGSFAIGPVPMGKLSVVASAPGLLAANAKASGSGPDVEKLKLFSPRRLGGKVLREGAPVAAATIRLEGEHKKLDATAGQDGAFAFSGLHPGRYTLAANTGFTQARASVELKEGKDVLDVVLDLGPGGEIAGVVRDGSGTAVADAKVSAHTSGTRAEQRTGKDGSYRLSALVAGKYDVSVDAEGHVEPERKEIEVAVGSAATADFVLESASPLKGVVVDEEGNPVDEASVSVEVPRPSRSDEDAEQPRGSSGHARSRRDGTFSVDQLAPGRFEVVAEHPAFKRQELSLTAPTTTARIVLSHGVALTGVVLDDEGKPVAGVRVVAAPDSKKSRPDERRAYERNASKSQEGTNSKGEFRIRGLEEGPHVVMAISGDSAKGSQRVRQNVEIHSPATGPITLQFAKGLSISGKVTLKDGKPVKEANVFAFADVRSGGKPAEDSLDNGFATAETGEDGAFVLGHLKPGAYKVGARSKTLFARSEPVSAQAGDTDVKIVVEGGGRIRGRLVQETGEPITHFKVDFRELRDANGAFEVPLRPSADGYVVFEADGFASTRRTVESKDGADVDLGDVVLSKGRSVSGKVLDARTRAPIAGALVDVGGVELMGRTGLRNSLEAGAVATRADGTFTLPHVETTPLGLFAQHDAYRWTERTLGAKEDNVTVLMDPGAVVTGSVTDAAGKPMGQAMIAARGEKTELSAVAEQGRFRFAGVPPGRLTFAVLSRGSERFNPQTIDVPESGEVKVDFQAASGGVRLLLSVPDEMYPLLFAGEVAAPTKMEEFAAMSITTIRSERGEGGWAFSALSPGPHTLLLLNRGTDHASLQVARQVLQVGTDPEQRVTVPKPESFSTIRVK
jgi:hypothetical protein